MHCGAKLFAKAHQTVSNSRKRKESKAPEAREYQAAWQLYSKLSTLLSKLSNQAAWAHIVSKSKIRGQKRNYCLVKNISRGIRRIRGSAHTLFVLAIRTVAQV